MKILKIQYINDSKHDTCIKLSLFEFKMSYRPGVNKIHTEEGTEEYLTDPGFTCDFCNNEVVNETDDKGNEIPKFVYMLFDNTWAICESCFNKKYKVLSTIDEKELS